MAKSWNQALPDAPRPDIGDGRLRHVEPLRQITPALFRPKDIQRFGGGDNRLGGIVADMPRPVAVVVGPVLNGRCPPQVVSTIVGTVAVEMRDLVQFGWLRPVERLAHERVYGSAQQPAAVGHLNRKIPVLLTSRRKAVPGLPAAILREGRAPYAAKVADLIGPAFNRFPNFLCVGHGPESIKPMTVFQ